MSAGLGTRIVGRPGGTPAQLPLMTSLPSAALLWATANTSKGRNKESAITDLDGNAIAFAEPPGATSASPRARAHAD